MLSPRGSLPRREYCALVRRPRGSRSPTGTGPVAPLPGRPARSRHPRNWAMRPRWRNPSWWSPKRWPRSSSGKGHLAEALTVYRELVRRSPSPPWLAERVAEVEPTRSGVSRRHPGRPTRPAIPAASRSPGYSRGSLAARPGDLPVRWPPRVSPALRTRARGTASATRPAPEPLSLGSVFGDEPPPVAPAMRAAAEAPSPAAAGPPVSFDAFFGARRWRHGPPAPPGPGPPARRGDDLEEFHAWLQSLKR